MDEQIEKILRYAKYYSDSSYFLNQNIQYNNAFIYSNYMMAGLSLELYFKALYKIDTNKEIKTHKFYTDIFKKLNIKIQQKLIDKFKLSNEDEDYAKSLENEIYKKSGEKLTIPRTLEDNLLHWENAFIKIRYLYENFNQEIHMMFFPNIEKALKEAIVELKTEYREVIL